MQAIAAGPALDLSRAPGWLVGPLNLFVLGTVLLAPIYRYRRLSNREQRQQTKWVVFGMVVALGVFLGLGALQTLVPWFTATPQRAVLFDLVTPAGALLGFTVLPITFAIAILRYRLWDIDLILNGVLVYATLTASVIGPYVLIVVGLGALFQARGNIVLSVLATPLAAILCQPLRERLQRGANRLMYRERDDPYQVISRLGQRLEETLAPGAALPTIVETVAEALKLPYAAIALKQDDELAVVGAYGTAVGEPILLPLVYQRDTVGQLIVSVRTGTHTLNPADLRLLNSLAHQARIAAHAVQLNADLQRSRERLVIAREEERRRLRRDVHDGLSPTLAGFFQGLDIAATLVPRDPKAAVVILEDLKSQVKLTIADIRRLVYAMRPPALDEYGLVSALHEHAAQRNGAHGLHVSFQAPEPLPPLPVAGEAAAYRIVSKALTNVARHAHARSCSICISIDDDLRLEIVDGGVGLPELRSAGVGLASMRERATELGGECIVEPTPGGGTRVRARLPIVKE